MQLPGTEQLVFRKKVVWMSWTEGAPFFFRAQPPVGGDSATGGAGGQSEKPFNIPKREVSKTSEGEDQPETNRVDEHTIPDFEADFQQPLQLSNRLSLELFPPPVRRIDLSEGRQRFAPGKRCGKVFFPRTASCPPPAEGTHGHQPDNPAMDASSAQ